MIYLDTSVLGAIFFREPNAALRAGDALHLAVARRIPADLATLDRRLADAAAGCGIALLPVG